MLKKYLVPLILAWTLCLGLFLAKHETATTDEGIHVASAYLALTRHEFRFDPEHPYLFKYLTALPLFALDLNLPPDDERLWDKSEPTVYDSWQEAREWSDQWFYASGNNADLMIFLSRIPGVLCFTLLCWFVYYLGKTWFSEKIGVFALIFTAFNPTLIAHGHFTNTDVPAALAFLGVIWALWNYYKKPSVTSMVILAVLFGVAQITKFSLIMLTPIVGLWLIYVSVVKGSFIQFIKHLGLGALITIAIIWLGYLLPITLLNGDVFTIRGSRSLPPLVPVRQEIFDKVLLLRFLLPVDYVKGLLLVLGTSYLGRPTYILEAFYSTGVWFYFPVIYVLKTQIAGLILLVVGAGLAIKDYGLRIFKPSPLALLLLFSTGLFLVASLTSKLNIGLRHIIPLMPFLSLAMALGLEKAAVLSKSKWLAPAMITLYVLPLALSFPHFLGYVNSFVQPRTEAYRYFNDSNLDWGQQGKEIADTIKYRFSNEKTYGEFRWNPYIMGYYGTPLERFDAKNPPKDSLLMFTATQLTFPEFESFKNLKPIHIIDNHTFFYRITE
jgi:hypothetical protein